MWDEQVYFIFQELKQVQGASKPQQGIKGEAG